MDILYINKSNKEKEIPVKCFNNYNNEQYLCLESKIKSIKGSKPLIKIKNNKNLIYIVDANKEHYLKINCNVNIFFVLSPGSSFILESISASFKNDIDFLFNKFKNDVLLVTPGYPSEENKYLCAFIHSRVQGYKGNNFNVDVLMVTKYNLDNITFYNFEGINVCYGNYFFLRKLLLQKLYKKILIHFIDPSLLKILEMTNLSNTQVLIYSHGVDTTYRDLTLQKNYQYEINNKDEFVKCFNDKDNTIKRLNSKSNIKFIFVSNWLFKEAEEKLNIKFQNHSIVPCFIDNKLFSNTKNNLELRKKILIIRPQYNLSTYSVDICVRTILELSRKPYFNDLEFSVYGDGTEHWWLTQPISRFSNVHLYNTFLNHNSLKNVFDNHGVLLIPSRYDTQCVIACEAAMNGLVLISSNKTGIKEFISENGGMYCDTENVFEYVDCVEKLYKNSNLYLQKKKISLSEIRKNCSLENTILKDINVITNFNNVESTLIPAISKKPLLTICIPCYNVAKYIIQILCKFLECKNSNCLEVLIINDGSKDNLKTIVTDFINKNSSNKNNIIFKLINKKNGGHGSAINTAIKMATGEFFKVLDGDDYFIPEELDKLIEVLKTSKTDVVLSDYIEDNQYTGDIKIINNIKLNPGTIYKVDDCCYDNYGFYGDLKIGFQLHTITIKTELLKNCGLQIEENCYYDDIVYDYICLKISDTLSYYPIHAYNYCVGNPSQSISLSSITKNLPMHIKVTKRIISEYNKMDLTPGKQYLIKSKLIPHLCFFNYYNIFRTKNKELFDQFNVILSNYKEFYYSRSIISDKIILYRNFGFLFKYDDYLRQKYNKLKNRFFAKTIIKHLRKIVYSKDTK